MTFTDYYNNAVCNISALLTIYSVTFVHLKKKAANTIVNKTAFQYNAYCMLANHSVSVSTRGQHWEGLAGDGVSLYRVVVGGFLYSEYQCIIGDSHIAPPVNRQTHTTENITFPQLRYLHSFVRLGEQSTMAVYVTVTTPARMMSSNLMLHPLFNTRN